MSHSPEVRRACDRCRKRKIKCDSGDPCSYCRSTSQACSYDLPIGKRGPKGPRTRRRQERRTDSFQEADASGGLPDVNGQPSDELSMLERLRRQLNESIQNEVTTIPVSSIAQHCITIYFRRSFPMFHEPSIRVDATYFFGTEGHGFPLSLDEHESKDGLDLMKSFAVLTALCAAQSFLRARSTIPYGALVAPKFLTAARNMFREYEDKDRQDPDVTSLQIRMLLSTSLQQHTGETGLAWHLVGEAGLIARRMRLYSENTISLYPPVEAAMLRNAFWMLYMADSSAECMQNRAPVLHEPLFDTKMDLAISGMNQVPLVQTGSGEALGDFEVNLFQGFHMVRRTWAAAARLMLAVREYGRLNSDNTSEVSIDSTQSERIAEMYSQFTASLDYIPSSLQPSRIFGEGDDSLSEEEKPCYISQRHRLLSAYYYTKLMIIHECGNLGLASIVGFQQDDTTLAREAINAARAFIHNLQSVQFHYLAELGEPEAEIMRAVGSILLAISQKARNAFSRQRALSQLNILLNILARLDSRASDKLTL